MNRFILWMLFGLFSINSFATVQTSAPVIIEHTNVTNNLTNIDENTDDLIQLKRKLEIEKAQAELKKIHNGANVAKSRGGSEISDNAQTIVTGIAINQNGKKIAWLQFADGGSLTVNIGSKVGKYTVSDISMTGVQLSSDVSKRSVFLKRVYYTPEKSTNNLGNIRNNQAFLPSPIVTSANTGSDIVPPIVSVR